MATPSSSGTTPSPQLRHMQPHTPTAASSTAPNANSPDDKEERDRAVQKFLARAELAKVCADYLWIKDGVGGPKGAVHVASSSVQENFGRVTLYAALLNILPSLLITVSFYLIFHSFTDVFGWDIQYPLENILTAFFTADRVYCRLTLSPSQLALSRALSG